MTPTLRAGVLAAAIVALDQVTKALVRASITRGDEDPVLPGVSLVNTRNTGVAFGLLDGAGPVVTVVIVAALVGFSVFFFVLKRVLRMAIRLAVVGALLLALLVGAVAWWWYDPLGGGSGGKRASPARPARPAR